MAEGLTDAQKTALSAAMRDAVLRGDADTVAACIARGGDVDWPVEGRGFTCPVPLMHFVVKNFNQKVAEVLWNATRDIDARDPKWGETALHVAAQGREYAAIAFLALHGADPLAPNKSGTRVPLEDLRVATTSYDAEWQKKYMMAMLPPADEIVRKKKDAPAPAMTTEKAVTPMEIKFKSAPKKNGGPRLTF